MASILLLSNGHFVYQWKSLNLNCGLRFKISSIIFVGKKRRQRYSASIDSRDSRLSTSHLERISNELKRGRHRSSTKRVYYNVWKNFNKFLIRLDRIPKTWEERVALYCAYLVKVKRRKSATIKTYVSGIKAILTDDGYIFDHKKLLLSSIIRSCEQDNDELNDRHPIQIGVLELLLMQIEKKFETQPYLEF